MKHVFRTALDPYKLDHLQAIRDYYAWSDWRHLRPEDTEWRLKRMARMKGCIIFAKENADWKARDKDMHGYLKTWFEEYLKLIDIYDRGPWWRYMTAEGMSKVQNITDIAVLLGNTWRRVAGE